MNDLSPNEGALSANSARGTTIDMRTPTNEATRPSRREKSPSAQAEPEPLARPEILGPRLFLIRHADASVGQKDGDGGRHLTALGQRQAEALARRIASWQIDAIFCSDMHRAVETAEAIHGFHPDVPLIVDATFQEASRGRIERHAQGDPEQANLYERLKSAWEKILDPTYEVKVVVAHNGLIKYFLGRTINSEGVLKPHFHCTETGITGIQLRPKRPVLEFFNDTHHLTPELVTPGPKAPWLESAIRHRS